MCHSMIVTLHVHVIPGVKQLFDFLNFLLGICNFAFNDPCCHHDLIMVETAVVHVGLLCVSSQIVKFVNVNAIPRIRYDLSYPLSIFLLDAVYQFFDKLFITLSDLLPQIRVFIKDVAKDHD